MIAPTMPERAAGTTALVTTSQRVAPSANIASRCDIGTEVMTSRETLTIVGRIMIARITPAANRPMPSGGPSNSEIRLPMVLEIQVSTVPRSSGERTNTPHRPMTTDGIAAISSTMNVSGIATRRGASSAR